MSSGDYRKYWRNYRKQVVPDLAESGDKPSPQSIR
jgi:hypothetical protein